MPPKCHTHFCYLVGVGDTSAMVCPECEAEKRLVVRSMLTPKQAIISADVEFLHGVPVHPTHVGAEAILSSLNEAGYAIVPKSALAWLFGEEGNFMPPEEKKNRPYWWRSEFRRRAGL